MTIKKGRPKSLDSVRRDQQTIVYLTPKQRQQLLKITETQGTTISSVIAEAVANYLAEIDNSVQMRDSFLIPTKFAQLVASQIAQILMEHGSADFNTSATHKNQIQPIIHTVDDAHLNPELTDFIKGFDL